jgi:gas vesicle protein
MSENTTPVGGYLAALGIGALVGAGLALLLAPRSGKETREQLAQGARDLKKNASGILENAQEMVHEKRAAITDAVAAAKEAMRSTGAAVEKIM